MFECRLTTADVFKKVVEALKDLVNEASIECKNSGMQLQAMDSSHVSLCALQLNKDGFESYRCDQDVVLGLSLTNVGKVLKCANSDDVLAIKHEQDSDQMALIFENKAHNKISDFEMKLMEIDQESLGIPEMEYKVTIKMPSSDFLKIMRDLSSIGDTCNIDVSKSAVQFSVNGDVGTGNVTVKSNRAVDSDEASVNIEMDEPVNLTFAIRYLVAFTKATPLSNTVTLKMSPDIPLLVSYDMEDFGYLRYFLAPKLDDMEDDDE